MYFLWLHRSTTLEQLVSRCQLEKTETGRKVLHDFCGKELFDEDIKPDHSKPPQDFPFPILKLPLELREKIYAIYLGMESDENATSTAQSERNGPTLSLVVYCRELEARRDSDDETYLNKSSLRELLDSPLLRSCHQIRGEALAMFYRYTQFIFCSITDLNIFISGTYRQKLRYIQLYEPTDSLEEIDTQVLHNLAISCPNLKTCRIRVGEQDILKDEATPT